MTMPKTETARLRQMRDALKSEANTAEKIPEFTAFEREVLRQQMLIVRTQLATDEENEKAYRHLVSFIDDHILAKVVTP